MDKLRIVNKDTGKDRDFVFNPTTLTFNQGVRYKKTPQPDSTNEKKDFQGGTGASLRFDLLLDEGTSEVKVKDDVAWLLELLEAKARGKVSPLSYTGTRDRPPICNITWGEQEYLTGSGRAAVLTSLNVTYTLFLADGTPTRAKVSLTFEDQYEKIQNQNPTSRSDARKTWLVTEGETLDWIAYREYGDPSQWRFIAETNNLSNPLELRPGQILKLVPLP